MHTPIILFVTATPLVDHFWTTLLEEQQYHIQILSTLSATSDWLRQQSADLIVIRAGNGIPSNLEALNHLCRAIAIPAILLAETLDEARILAYYEAGIDDCILNPTAAKLFVAKIQVWLRRTWTLPTEVLSTTEVGNIELDPIRREAVVNGNRIKLTNLEFRLLYLLLAHPFEILETHAIIQKVWGYENRHDPTILKHLVYRLRQKIEPNPAQPRYIVFIPDEGYRFQPVELPLAT